MKPDIATRLFIALFVLIMGIFVGLLIVEKVKTEREVLNCGAYERYPIRDLPVGCYKYYGINEGGD